MRGAQTLAESFGTRTRASLAGSDGRTLCNSACVFVDARSGEPENPRLAHPSYDALKNDILEEGGMPVECLIDPRRNGARDVKPCSVDMGLECVAVDQNHEQRDLGWEKP